MNPATGSALFILAHAALQTHIHHSTRTSTLILQGHHLEQKINTLHGNLATLEVVKSSAEVALRDSRAIAQTSNQMRDETRNAFEQVKLVREEMKWVNNDLIRAEENLKEIIDTLIPKSRPAQPHLVTLNDPKDPATYSDAHEWMRKNLDLLENTNWPVSTWPNQLKATLNQGTALWVQANVLGAFPKNDPYLDKQFFHDHFAKPFTEKVYTAAMRSRLNDELMAKKQRPRESTDSYCNAYNLLAIECNIKDDDSTIIQRFISSLQPEILRAVHGIHSLTPFKSLTAIYDAARSQDLNDNYDMGKRKAEDTPTMPRHDSGYNSQPWKRNKESLPKAAPIMTASGRKVFFCRTCAAQTPPSQVEWSAQHGKDFHGIQPRFQPKVPFNQGPSRHQPPARNQMAVQPSDAAEEMDRAFEAFVANNFG